MPGILFDFREIEQWAAKLGVAADQIPFATARAINDSIFATRKVLVDEMWPSVVNVANPHYPSAVLRVDTATKYHLTASIHEIKETSTPLILHAKGGTKTKRKGRHFTIPTKEYKQAHRTQRGLAKRATAHELIARTPRRALRITDRGIFVGEAGRLRLAFVFKSDVHVPKDVPFYEVFATEMQRRLFERLPSRLIGAMATRKSTTTAMPTAPLL